MTRRDRPSASSASARVFVWLVCVLHAVAGSRPAGNGGERMTVERVEDRLPCLCTVTHVATSCPRHRAGIIAAVFPWPCDRRDAHHPHPRMLYAIQHPDPANAEVGDAVTVYPMQLDEECPGVRAHPATMIGRAS